MIINEHRAPPGPDGPDLRGSQAQPCPACTTVRTPVTRSAKLRRRLSAGASFMIGISTLGSPAPNGLLGSLRSWLSTWSGQTWQPADDMP
ncbi:MAG: hypothetical protein Q8L92_18300, partial [Rubrivivax sp.]|nr:hypothetical protein [Rubrivivax sp.]